LHLFEHFFFLLNRWITSRHKHQQYAYK